MRKLLVALALVAAACQAEPQARIFEGPDVDAIRARDAGLAQAINQRDAEAAAAFYDLGGLIMERTPTWRTPIGAKARYEELFADLESAMELSRIEVEVARSRDLAVSQGECTVRRNEPELGHVVFHSNICMKSWRRGEDDVWRIGWETRTMIARFDP